MLGEWELQFKDCFYELVVSTVKVVVDPSMEKLQLKQRDLFLSLIFALNLLPGHV